ncbi:hypothetical protein HDU89_001148 [Geranomyces variabilis]|nr:hypothetical protein HDU89_001148 [Geranomyces variabilis]
MSAVNDSFNVTYLDCLDEFPVSYADEFLGDGGADAKDQLKRKGDSVDLGARKKVKEGNGDTNSQKDINLNIGDTTMDVDGADGGVKKDGSVINDKKQTEDTSDNENKEATGDVDGADGGVKKDGVIEDNKQTEDTSDNENKEEQAEEATGEEDDTSDEESESDEEAATIRSCLDNFFGTCNDGSVYQQAVAEYVYEKRNLDLIYAGGGSAYIFNGTIWTKSKKAFVNKEEELRLEVMKKLKTLLLNQNVKSLIGRLENLYEEDGNDDLICYAKKLARASSRIKRPDGLFKSFVHNMIDFEEKLNKNTRLLGFADDVIDMHNLQAIRFCPSKREDYLTEHTNYKITVQTDETHIRAEVEKKLAETFPIKEERDFVLQTKSLMLIGCLMEKMYFCEGKGSSGKSTVDDLMNYAMGQMGAAFNTSFLSTALGGAKAQPEAVKMRGKRYVGINVSDTAEKGKTCQLNYATIKVITGGNPVSVRNLYQNLEDEFVNVAQFWIYLNILPIITSLCNGLWRRIVVVKYRSEFVEDNADVDHAKYRFKKDLGFKKRIRANKAPYGRAMIFILLDYLKDVKLDGENEPIPPALPGFYAEATYKYQLNSNIFATFLIEKCSCAIINDRRHYVEQGDLTRIFLDWASKKHKMQFEEDDASKNLRILLDPSGMKSEEEDPSIYQITGLSQFKDVKLGKQRLSPTDPRNKNKSVDKNGKKLASNLTVYFNLVMK